MVTVDSTFTAGLLFRTVGFAEDFWTFLINTPLWALPVVVLVWGWLQHEGDVASKFEQAVISLFGMLLVVYLGIMPLSSFQVQVMQPPSPCQPTSEIYQEMEFEMEEAVNVPILLGTVLQIYGGFSYALPSIIDCDEDIRGVLLQAINDEPIMSADGGDEDLVTPSEVARYVEECYIPMKQLHEVQRLNLNPYVERFGYEDLQWPGSVALTETYGRQIRAKTPVFGFDPTAGSITAGYITADDQWDVPSCYRWWTGEGDFPCGPSGICDGAGLRDRIYGTIDIDHLNRISNYAQEQNLTLDQALTMENALLAEKMKHLVLPKDEMVRDVATVTAPGPYSVEPDTGFGWIPSPVENVLNWGASWLGGVEAESLKQALPAIQTIFLCFIVLCWPIIGWIGMYKLGPLLALSGMIIALSLLSYVWAWGVYVDNQSALAAYPNLNQLLGTATGHYYNGDYQTRIHQLQYITSMLYQVLPVVFMILLGTTGWGLTRVSGAISMMSTKAAGGVFRGASGAISMLRASRM